MKEKANTIEDAQNGTSSRNNTRTAAIGFEKPVQAYTSRSVTHITDCNTAAMPTEYEKQTRSLVLNGVMSKRVSSMRLQARDEAARTAPKSYAR
jgi:hypothetical protein